jgi:hypothetical protein
VTASSWQLSLGAIAWTLLSCTSAGEVDLGSRCPRTRGCASGGMAGIATNEHDASTGGGDAGGAPALAEASVRDSATGGSVGTDGAVGTDTGARPSIGPDDVWSPLSVMAIVNPMEHGAVGNGSADDLGALTRTVSALPEAGGIVYLPETRVFKKTNVLVVTRSHVKFWAPNGQGVLLQSIDGQARHQSVLCQRNTGCGFFGVKFWSDAAARLDALEDNHVSADHASLIEVVGCDVDGAAATGIFLLASTEHYIEGNYLHHSWAGHIHHTEGARESWVWGNYMFNESPSLGDNGVGCVTYGATSPRCGDMEWWKNAVLGSKWGRGYAVLGGEDISIHDNWAIGVPGAGISVASEAGAYDSPGSSRIDIRNNAVTQCGDGIGHPGILVSGLNAAAAPLSDITLTDNIATANPNGAYRAEGAYTNVLNTGLQESAGSLPTPVPAVSDVRLADTGVLRTRDVSHVSAAFRPGLHRIHVRESPGGSGFEQRFEYVVKGPIDAIDALVAARTQANDYLSEKRADSSTAHALLLTREPIAISSEITGVTFREVRAGDASGVLSWLWQRIDSGAY